jgi:hypothetical protein
VTEHEGNSTGKPGAVDRVARAGVLVSIVGTVGSLWFGWTQYTQAHPHLRIEAHAAQAFLPGRTSCARVLVAIANTGGSGVTLQAPIFEVSADTSLSWELVPADPATRRLVSGGSLFLPSQHVGQFALDIGRGYGLMRFARAADSHAEVVVKNYNGRAPWTKTVTTPVLDLANWARGQPRVADPAHNHFGC